ncbi:stalk domain-containing protein [Intestinibacillus massiliensis]|uniref:stalk domain-containing protein n=1 Tax=Intestinibacillus massiliensis TaxID=1871029 RepID=UPI000B355BAB|nr:stalk domain-containing protein [Intestinibacillus massiliensis]
MKVKKWRAAMAGVLFSGLISTMVLSVSAAATNKSIGNGAVTFRGITSESTVQVALYDEQSKPVTVPLYQMDKSAVVSHDKTITDGDMFLLYDAYEFRGSVLVPASQYEDTGIHYEDHSKDGTDITERKFTFTKDGYFLAEYDPAPLRTSYEIVPSDDVQYCIIQIGGAAKPTEPAKPTLVATPNQSAVLVNGVATPFEAYTIQENNYFKLRDIASVLNGSNKQFEVTWDGEKNAINLITNQPYTVVGGEMTSSGMQATVTPTLNTATILLNGKPISLTAYTINDNNYFKLRDLAAQIDFGVTWDGATGTIGIDSNTGYTAE